MYIHIKELHMLIIGQAEKNCGKDTKKLSTGSTLVIGSV